MVPLQSPSCRVRLGRYVSESLVRTVGTVVEVTSPRHVSLPSHTPRTKEPFFPIKRRDLSLSILIFEHSEGLK